MVRLFRSDAHRVAPGRPTHLSWPRLGHKDPLSSIEKRFVLSPVLYAALLYNLDLHYY